MDNLSFEDWIIRNRLNIQYIDFLLLMKMTRLEIINEIELMYKEVNSYQKALEIIVERKAKPFVDIAK